MIEGVVRYQEICIVQVPPDIGVANAVPAERKQDRENDEGEDHGEGNHVECAVAPDGSGRNRSS